MVKQINLSNLIIVPFHDTFLSKANDQVDVGGRGSTKSSKNSLKTVFHIMEEQKCGAVVLRRYQNSLRNSVYKEIKRACTRLRTSRRFRLCFYYLANGS